VSIPLSPSKLWRQIPPDRRTAIAQAFWDDDESAAQQIEALAHIARQLKFRVQSVQKLPPDKKVRHLASVPGVPDTVAGRALIVYHLAHQRPMLTSFLDALQIPHEDGLINEHVAPPTSDALRKAAAALAPQFPPDAVRLYFSTLLAQDPETWEGLEAVLDEGGQ
jgi:hypothetical protein